MTSAVEPRFYTQTWDLSYRHALGDTTSRFLAGLAEQRILGRRCPSCERVIVPARSFCDRDHTATSDWVEVATAGVVEMFTIVHEAFRGLPDPPYALAYATLDGADTALVGYVRGLDLTDLPSAVASLAVGNRVRVAFSDTPTGTAADYWFEPA
ncbi:protein of unknown function DUF35 [Pseudonocardia dioxanivorans CB1190]|uniref:DUF35 domain-containing protein n=1 Tax=Pseudonocardia dioxanivorans (strain ATCC 55486 / DSM 44775 / JCM 13855 / CB1190) TaxID=675635 RepID=F4CJP8_PSEUX|nr:OB-fold domain-containing protein [Pseudonocardia dioxanivorans]AEA25908.1 protein of unknown function DUF35 [Pseudonocardia dioxanivorans CB1190]GJF06333.1 hypothetical protein PSD17_52800 [Pseudonocardia sp. D17]